VLWGFFNGEAKRALSGLAGVEVVEKHRRPRFIFEGRMFVRLKKLRSDGVAANYPTQRSLHFDKQLELEGEGLAFQLPRVDIGYVLNELATSVSDVLAVHRKGRSTIWTLPLTGQPEVISIGREASDEERPRRFRAKNSELSADSQGTDGD
jgi:hypothetical protein